MTNRSTASISQQGNITITETTTNTGPTVYAAGFYPNGTSTTACYWANGTRFDLGGTGISTANPAHATSIFAASGNIYVGGYYNNGTGYVGCYWVIDASGVATKTDLPGANANVNAIFVSGGTVYTAGYYFNGTQNIACYWTAAGNPVSLPSAGISFATSLYVTGSTIYVAGQDSFSIACYWTIAGTTAPAQTPLTVTGAGAAIANSISGSGTSISIAGQDTSTSGTPTAVYWTGSNLAEISLNLANGSANSIFVSGGAIYIAGQYNDLSANPVGFYWSGAETDLTGPGGTAASTISGGINAQSVYVSGTTAYVAGYYGSPATASYWTIAGSTISQALNLSAANSGQAVAIVVQ